MLDFGSNTLYNIVMVKKESIPTLTLEIEAEDLRETFGNLGHTVVDISANSPDIKDIRKTIEATYPILFPTIFKEYCTYHGLNQNWPNRLWNGLVYYQSKAGTDAPERYIDMSVLRNQIRRIESGELVMKEFGEPTWNIYAGLNNENETDRNNHILPWNESIHSYLRQRFGSEAHSSAVAILRDLYSQYVLEV